jgi:uncharacterized protein YijF (DUF1287 family)
MIYDPAYVGLAYPMGDVPIERGVCTVGGTRPHIMIVSDAVTSGGVPLVIHNIGGGTQEEDRLYAFPITGHYRVAPANGNRR